MFDEDDLAEKRRALEELLYDFEDFIELDTFDPAKFTDIQAATRSFALVILDAIQRVKIDVKTPTTPVHKFPPLPPLPPLPPQLAQSLSASPQIRPSPLRAGSHGAANISSFPAVPRQPKPSVSRSRARGSHGSSDSATVRRAHSIAESTDSDPASSRGFSGAVSSSRGDRRPPSPGVLSDGMGKLRIVTSPEPLQPRTSDWVEEQTSVPKPRRPFRGSIPENSAVGDDAFSDGTFVSRIHRRGFDAVTPQSSVFDPTSPSTTNRTSVYSDVPTYSSNVTSPKLPTIDVRMSPSAGTKPDPALAIDFPSSGLFTDGLMLADEQAASETSTQHLRSISAMEKEEGCLIGPKSSFHQLKGFCDGAQTFRRGGYWHGIKQTMTWVSQTSNPENIFERTESSLGTVRLKQEQGEPLPIGRCMDCEYHHLNRSLTLDKEGDCKPTRVSIDLLCCF